MKKNQNSILFLGTGTSVGVPMIGCSCEVCRSEDKKDKRLRTSAFLHYQGKNILIDIGPDFRLQMLQNSITHIDAILLTHPHRDHIGGFDDIRALNFIYEKSLELYANDFTWQSLKKQFYYAFLASDYTSVPKVNFNEIGTQNFDFEGVNIIPIQVLHGKMPCLGFRFGNMAYITDANFIEIEELDKLKHLDILVINSLRKQYHPSHFSLADTLEVVAKIKPKKTYLTHLSHHMGLQKEVQAELPENVWIAWDGLKLEF